jgi:ABC-type transport system substrate-binding protein
MLRNVVVSAGIIIVLSLALAAPQSACALSGEKTLIVGQLTEPSSLNPLVATSNETKDIVWRIYLKLLDEKPNYMDFSPRLARSWEFSADSLTITFHLRDDVRWTDGVAVTAEDVRFTWELHRDSVVASRSSIGGRLHSTFRNATPTS